MAPYKQPNNKYRVRWTDEHGRRRSKVFARFRDAERYERRMKDKVENIVTGLAKEIDVTKTFDDAADYWLENRAVHKRSEDDDKSIIRAHLRPAFGPLFLRHVDVEAVDQYFSLLYVPQPRTMPMSISSLMQRITAQSWKR